jgi:hypothetical protein
VFPVLVVLGVLLSSFFVVIPMIQSTLDDRDTLEQKEELVKKLVDKRAYLQSLDPLKMKKDLDLVELALPREKPVVEFLVALAALLEGDENLRFTGYEFNPGSLATASAQQANARVNTKGIQDVPVESGFEGDVETLLNLVTHLEELMPLVDFEGFELKGLLTDLGTEETTDDLGLNVVLRLHYAGIPEKLGAVEASVEKITKAEEQVIADLVNFSAYSPDESGGLELFDQAREDIFGF